MDIKGLKVRIKENLYTLDFVNLYLTEQLYQLIVDETNRYANQFLRDNPEKVGNYYVGSWVPVDMPEMKKFLALPLLTG